MEVKVRSGFLRLSDKKTVSIDSISVWGVGSDSLIYKNEPLSQMALELNPNTQVTNYLFQVKSGGYLFTDTIKFYHTNKPWFESMECGCMVFSTLDSCKTTGSIFKSVTIVNSEIQNSEKQNVLFNL